MANSPTINLSDIGWENFDESWEIDSLESSEFLPDGAEKAVVWRDEDYKLKAKIVGTVAYSSPYGLSGPEGEPGSLLPIFELKGSGTNGILNYELGSCTVLNIDETEWVNADAKPPLVRYERELSTSGVCKTNRARNLAEETEWLSEWYLNGPRGRITSIYPRGTGIKLEGKYVRRRKLPGNEEDTFEASKTVGGARFAFVETDTLSFLIQRVPQKLGPSWSECVAIEYRPAWGGIPSAEDREAIAAIVGFVMGRELINIGYTRFDELGLPIQRLALHPLKPNLISTCQKSYGYLPVKMISGIESVLGFLVPNYLTLKDELRLNEVLSYYWRAQELPIGFNLPILGAGVEALARSWSNSKQSKTKGGVYMPKKDFEALLRDEFNSASVKLEGHEYKDQILNKLRSSYNLSVQDDLRFFFNGIKLLVSDAEWSAMRKRNPMAHGYASVFDASANEKMREATHVYETLFHRILLKVLDYHGYYVDYGTLGFPVRHVNEPSGSS